MCLKAVLRIVTYGVDEFRRELFKVFTGKNRKHDVSMDSFELMKFERKNIKN